MAYTLNDQETIEELQKNLNLIIKTDNAPEAFLFAKKLKDVLNDSKLTSDLSKKNLVRYNKMLRKAKFVSLYKQKEEDIIELINKRFNDIFSIQFYDILDKIDDYLSINVYVIEERDKFKERLKKVLLESKTKITSEEIDISGEKNNPTIANWLKDFRDNFTEQGFNDPVKITKYISENSNFLKLNNKDKEKVKTLINLYAHLKIPSSSLEGLEENISVITEEGESAILSKGQLEKIPQAVIDIFNEVQKKTGGELYDLRKNRISQENKVEKVFDPPEEKVKKTKKDSRAIDRLLESYKKFEKDVRSLDDNLTNLDQYKNNPDKILNKFNKDLEDENRDNLLADIIFICENKLLDNFFQENKDLLIEFKKDLGKKLSDDIIDNIVQNSDRPETVSLYLQFLLFKKLKLSPKNSGLFGMHLANIFKKIGQEKYFPIVYGDLNLERFVWREVIEENGLVKFK